MAYRCAVGNPKPPGAHAEEECAVQRVWIDRAVCLELDFVSPVCHPHAVYHMSAQCKSIELIMQYLAAEEIPTTTYSALYQRYQSNPGSIPGPDVWNWDAEMEDVRTQEFRMIGPDERVSPR